MFTMSRIHSFHDNSKMFFATSIEDIIDVTFLSEHALSAGLSGKRASCMTGFNRKAAKQNLPELSSSPILESTQEHNQQNQRFLHSVDSVRSTTWRKMVIIVFFEHKNYSCEPSLQAVQPLLYSLDALTRQLVQGSRFRKEKKAHNIEMLATKQKSRIMIKIKNRILHFSKRIKMCGKCKYYICTFSIVLYNTVYDYLMSEVKHCFINEKTKLFLQS